MVVHIVSCVPPQPSCCNKIDDNAKKARIIGLFWRPSAENFIVKTVDDILKFGELNPRFWQFGTNYGKNQRVEKES